VLPDVQAFDRTSIDAWEDEEFVAAVKATGRKKLIMVALWTEVCLVFPALNAMKEGYEVYPVVDAVGGTSPEARRAGLEHIVRAGGEADRLGAVDLRICNAIGCVRRRFLRSRRSCSPSRGTSPPRQLTPTPMNT